jgi:tetratricopeptide (TPR) repeat protein
VEPVQETAWTEEIDLSLEEEEPAGAVFSSHGEQELPDLDADPVAGEAEEPVGVTLERDLSEELHEPLELSDEGVEVTLELELDEDELTELAGPYGHSGQAEPVLGDILPEAEAEVGAGGSARPDPAPLFELNLSGDDYGGLETELLAEIEEEGVPVSADYDKYSLDGLFSAFKKGVDQQLGEEDTETHYNLGIAYKEMGLYDDAIAEFDAAALDPRRKVDCLTLQGICCREKGDLNRAEEVLRRGLALPELTEEDAAPLKYELALLYETAGRTEDALFLYREITAATPGFRDAAEKITSLLGGEAQEYYDLDLVELQGEDE